MLAGKIIENVQKNLHVALVLEPALLFERLHIDIVDVIRAAATDWIFNDYVGTCVGGHCLPIDPHYFVQKAAELGYHAPMITTGRAIKLHAIL
jgi:UDP-N-acetyl-D-galactosamine dehydrogenase